DSSIPDNRKDRLDRQLSPTSVGLRDEQGQQSGHHMFASRPRLPRPDPVEKADGGKAPWVRIKSPKHSESERRPVRVDSRPSPGPARATMLRRNRTSARPHFAFSTQPTSDV